VIRDPIYTACSRYSTQIERYLEVFPREQLLLLTAEGLRSDREATMRRVFGFLGVDPAVIPPTLATEYYRTDGRARYPPIAARVRHTVKRYVPGAKRAKELVDSTLPRAVRFGPKASAPTPRVTTTVPHATRESLLAMLSADLDRLSAYLPGAIEGWSLDRDGAG
jgi:hypothetical protein